MQKPLSRVQGMMGWWYAPLLWAALLITFLPATAQGTSSPDAVRVLRVSPTDGTGDVPRVTPVVVFFDRPMVSLTALESPAAAPARLDPAVPGYGRWLNTATWAWYPAHALHGATRYTLTVARGLRAVDGARLAGTYRSSFSTPRPTVARVWPADAEQYTDFRGAVTVRFNQSVERVSAMAAFALRDEAGRDVPGAFSWPRSDTLIFRPYHRLALGAPYHAVVSAGLRSAEGPLVPPGRTAWDFTTAGIPTVSATTPGNGERAANMSNGLTLSFTSPVDPRLVRKRLRVIPRPTGMNVGGSSDGLSISVYGDWSPSTHYRLALDGVIGTYGQALPRALRMGFITAPLDLAVQLTYSNSIVGFDAYRPVDIGLRAVNTHGLTMSLYPLSRDQFVGLLQSYDVQHFSPGTAPLYTLHRRLPAVLNKTEGVGQELSAPGGGTLRPGFYFLAAISDEGASDQMAFMVTRTAVTFKVAPGHTFVWATDLHSGRPLRGLLVRVVRADTGGLVAAGHTGGDGVLDVPDSTTQTYGLVALVDRPGDAALCSSNWNSGVGAYDFNLPASYGLSPHQGYLYTDRPIYRPGQPVRFRGLLRRDDDGAYTLLARTTPVRVTMTDSGGHLLYNRLVHPDAFGAFAGTVTLGAGAALGWDNLNAQVGAQYFSVTLQVAAYRKPDYTVTAAPARPDGNYTTGWPVRVTVAARYLFGAPLNRARVHWSVLSSDLYLSAPDYPDYTFQDYPFIPFLPFAGFGARTGLAGYPAPANASTDIYGFGSLCYGCGGYSGPAVVAQGDARTDAAGNLTLSIPADLRRYRLSQQWSVEADVSDVDNASISGRTVVSVHKGLFYVGLRGPSALAIAGKPARIDLLTIGQDGTTLIPRVPLTVRLYRRTYHTVFAGGIAQWQPVDTLITSFAAATNGRGWGSAIITLPSSGEFRLAAAAHDARGNLVRSAISLYAAGPDEAASPWANPPRDRITLVPDRRLYRVGDVAHVLVAAPRPGMTALVTIERGRVYSHQVLRFSGASPILRVPIRPGYLPDVFLSVVLVAGSGPHAGTPLWKMGVVELPVDVRARKLTVTLHAGTLRAHPGDAIALRLHAAGPDGRPVRGQFSLALVDEAVLSLAADQSPAILDAFYAERGLGVQTSYSQNVAAFQLPLVPGGTPAAPAREQSVAYDAAHAPLSHKSASGGGGGGGGSGQATAPRAYFPDTAYWNPAVLTDARGDATLTVTLPDSLTTWRVVARGLTAGTLVGQAALDVVSTRDLLLRPLLPRFFTLDDRAEVGAVVNNTTARTVVARVGMSAGSGQSAVGSTRYPSAMVTIAAGSERLVTWPLTVGADSAHCRLPTAHCPLPTSVRLLLTVSAAGVSGDSVLVSAPVEPNSTPEVVATSGEVGVSRVERVVVPRSAEPGEGGLTLTLQPSLAAGLRSSVDYLQHYPFESNEDLAARIMGEVALLRLPAAATGLSAATLAAYRADVRASIGLLLAVQRGDGGWGWWLGDLYSSPSITAFCLDALGTARRAGYAVFDQPLHAAAGYVSGQAQAAAASPLALPSGPGAVPPDLSAYMAYVLDANGVGGAADALYAARDQLPLWSRAYLLRALRLENGGQLGSHARTVLAELEAAAHLDAAGAHWESSGDDATMDDSIHATAVVLDALLEADPSSPLIAPATRWLVSARGGEVWPTTVDNAVALRALSDELRGTGELAGQYHYSASLDSAPWGSGAVDPTTLAQSRVLAAPIGRGLPPGSAARVSLSRSNRSGRLYYTLRLAYYPRVDQVRPLAHGVAVARQYLYNGRPVSAAPVGAVLRVRLTVSSAQDLYYVAIDDPLPAGAEAVDPTLLTTSQLQTGGYTVPKNTSDLAWYMSHAELRDDRATLFAGYLPVGVYRYEYTIQLTTRGTFHALPAHVAETYFPEVFGRSAGGFFTVE